MKASRVYVFSFVLLMLMFVQLSIANAELIDNGDGTIKQVRDDGSILMWLQDASYSQTSGYDDDGFMLWSEAMFWAENLEFAGYSDWRLPSTPVPDDTCSEAPVDGYNCTQGELANLFYIEGITLESQGPFINIRGDPNVGLYMYENIVDYYPSTGDVGVFFDFSTGLQARFTYLDIGPHYAWAVRVVPEPISSTLFIVGGATLGFRCLRKKYRK